MNDHDRLRAEKYQLRYFLANQHPIWRVAMIQTIKRIMKNPIDFYMPFLKICAATKKKKWRKQSLVKLETA